MENTLQDQPSLAAGCVAVFGIMNVLLCSVCFESFRFSEFACARAMSMPYLRHSSDPSLMADSKLCTAAV